MQDENDDDDDWNPCKAAGVCLMLLATCCEDDVVPHVLPFIKEHIKHPDWRYRDASIMAFGSILEGPELNLLKPLVVQVRVPTIMWTNHGSSFGQGGEEMPLPPIITCRLYFLFTRRRYRL